MDGVRDKEITVAREESDCTIAFSIVEMKISLRTPQRGNFRWLSAVSNPPVQKYPPLPLRGGDVDSGVSCENDVFFHRLVL